MAAQHKPSPTQARVKKIIGRLDQTHPDANRAGEPARAVLSFALVPRPARLRRQKTPLPRLHDQ